MTKDTKSKRKSDLLIAPSLASAAAQLQCSRQTLREAKKLGAPGFRGNGNVSISELKPWLAEHALELAKGQEKEALEIRRLLLQCEKLEHEIAVVQGEYLSKEKHDEILSRCALRAKQACQRIITEPPNWAGLTPVELSRKGKSIFEAICRELENPGNY